MEDSPRSAMALSPDLSKRLTQVVHLYLSVAHAGSGDQEPHERQLAVQLSQQWAPWCDRTEIEAVVDTAYVAVRSGFSVGFESIAEELRRELPPALCTRLLTDLGLMALADGRVTLQEARVIGLVREAFRNQTSLSAA